MMADTAGTDNRRGVAAYTAVTLAYWAFMLSDGALRMLVLLHFHELGFAPLALAWLFIVYEAMGVITNLAAGWLGTRFGLKPTLVAGLALQIAALLALTTLDSSWSRTASVVFVMGLQGVSGIAKDLTKTSAKSALKGLVADVDGRLFRMVALLTGSKNAVKGIGFLLGAGLLATVGFRVALLLLVIPLAFVLLAVTLRLTGALGRPRRSARFAEVFSTNPSINRLSLARLFLFASRDAWFVVGVPVFLNDAFVHVTGDARSAFFWTGAFMASWIVFYGIVQASAPRWLAGSRESLPRVAALARRWNGWLVLTLAPLLLLAAWPDLLRGVLITSLIAGLWLFGFVFAVNSSLHSYLILALSRQARAAMDVGFYYMSNAAGRLLGTVVSGLAYGSGGLPLCLVAATVLAIIAWRTVARLSNVASLQAADSRREEVKP